MKPSDKKFYFVVFMSLLYLFWFLAAIAFQRIDAALLSLPLFIIGLLNSSGLTFGGFILGVGTHVPSSRNSKHNPQYRLFSGLVGWVILVCSFIPLLVAIDAYNK